jgi:hypothetical protein
MSTTPLLSSSHDYASRQSGRGITVRDNTYGACDNGTYTPTTDGAASLQGAEDAPDRIKVLLRTTLCVGYSYRFRRLRLRRRRSTLIRPGVKYSGAYAGSLPTFGQRTAIVYSSLPYVTHFSPDEKKNLGTQLSSQLLCVLVLIVGRFVNVAVPFLFADLVFAFEQGITGPPWLLLFGYVGLRFLQSSGGLPALRDVRRTSFVFSSRHVHSIPFFPRFSGLPFYNTRIVVRKMEVRYEKDAYLLF